MTDNISIGRASCLGLTLLFVSTTGSCVYLGKDSIPYACPSNSGAPIRNFCVVIPGTLWRGAEFDNHGAAWLVQQGARTVVDLQLIHDDRSAFREAKIADTGKHEVRYFRVRDWEPARLLAPSLVDDRIAHFIAIIREQPKPVYIHCRFGMDRTSVMIAAYRMLVEGIDTEQAIEEMGRYHGAWHEADAAYVRSLTPERLEEIRRKAMALAPKLTSDADIACESHACIVSDR